MTLSLKYVCSYVPLAIYVLSIQVVKLFNVVHIQYK